MDLLIHFTIWGIGLFGGASMIENTLENWLMNQPWFPSWAKKAVIPVISFVFAVVASVYGGVPLPQAIAGALALGGSIATIHNHPDLTSSLPPPPANAWGVPGDPPLEIPAQPESAPVDHPMIQVIKILAPVLEKALTPGPAPLIAPPLPAVNIAPGEIKVVSETAPVVAPVAPPAPSVV